MYRTLIVARMEPGSQNQVAREFTASDATELPTLIGVRSRTLFSFKDVYLHLIEASRPVGPAVARLRDHPLFRDINERLASHISPYDPATWAGPADATAHEFYRWELPPSPRQG
jgi:cyclase